MVQRDKGRSCTLTSSDGGRPREPVVECVVAVVQPVLVPCAGQAVAELDDVADVRGGDRRVGPWTSYPGTVVQPVPGAALAQVARDLDRQVRRPCHLQQDARFLCLGVERLINGSGFIFWLFLGYTNCKLMYFVRLLIFRSLER